MKRTAPCWTVCQIGAREHYALAAAFAAEGRLDALVTDLWVLPDSIEARIAGFAGRAGRAFQDRYHSGLTEARVLTPSMAGVKQGIINRMRLRRTWAWDTVHKTNQRLGNAFVDALRRSCVLERPGPRALFAYSYGALEVLNEAKQRGAIAILGQIDPGPAEARHVEAIAAQLSLASDGELMPGADYWERWRAECKIADRIVVNSDWSRSLLIAEGVEPAKIAVVPLAYCPPEGHLAVLRSETLDRRLEILFLGQVSVRKGIVELMDAMNLLMDCDIRLTIIGKVEPRLTQLLTKAPPNVLILGQVPRSEVDRHYKYADLFVFPTHSDGFGLTQLEAMANGLPVLASRHCGAVVRDGVDGRVLESVTPDAIASMIRWFCDHREKLTEMREAATQRVGDFGAKRIAGMLDTVAADAAQCPGDSV